MAEGTKSNPLAQLESTLEEYFGKKAPALPQGVKDFIVKIAPYLTIIGLILTIPAILLLVGLGSFATVLAPIGGAQSVTSVPTMWVGILLLIPVVVLEAMAVPGLFAKKISGWRYVFWAQLISLVSNLVQLNIIGAIIGAIIGFYFLFQIKNSYK